MERKFAVIYRRNKFLSQGARRMIELFMDGR